MLRAVFLATALALILAAIAWGLLTKPAPVGSGMVVAPQAETVPEKPLSAVPERWKEPVIPRPTPTRTPVAVSRDVTTGGITPGPDVTAPLERVPGPDLPESLNMPPPSSRLNLVVVKQAGVMESKGQVVTLTGIIPTPLDTACPAEDGRNTRPCGQLAATAMKRFIRNRSITCDYREDDDYKGPRTGNCTLGRWNVAGWLVCGGWVRTTDDAPDDLKALEREVGDLLVLAPRD